MIIYKANKPISKYPKEKECSKCSSLLGIEEADIIIIAQFDQREGRYNISGFKCPICNTEQPLNKK